MIKQLDAKVRRNARRAGFARAEKSGTRWTLIDGRSLRPRRHNLSAKEVLAKCERRMAVIRKALRAVQA